jgi:hypothetical protein
MKTPLTPAQAGTQAESGGGSGVRMGSRLRGNERNRKWLSAAPPYLWLLVFFAFPFVLVAKLSLSHTVLAVPP